MIRHYDMTTGEEVAEETGDGPEGTLPPFFETELPRLMTVREAIATQMPEMRLPADLASLPVEMILAKWS